MTRRTLTAALVGVLFLVTGCTTDNPVEPAQEADSIQELSHPVLDATALKDFIENQTAGECPQKTLFGVPAHLSYPARALPTQPTVSPLR